MSDSFVTPWIVVCQAPLSMGFPRQEYWSWLPFPSPGNLSNPEIKLRSPALTSRFFTVEPSGKSKGFYSYTLKLLPTSHFSLSLTSSTTSCHLPRPKIWNYPWLFSASYLHIQVIGSSADCLQNTAVSPSLRAPLQTRPLPPLPWAHL